MKTGDYKTNAKGTLTFLSQMKLTWLRAEVSMVFQQFNLWPNKTVLQNITEGPRIVKKTPQEEAEAKAGIHRTGTLHCLCRSMGRFIMIGKSYCSSS